MTTVADSNGDWTVPNPGNLKDGDEVTATAKDPAGNEGTAKEPVDGVAPTIDIDPITQKDIDDPTDPITGTTEPNTDLTVTFPDGSTVTVQSDANGKWSVPNPGNLKDGQVIDVVAKDKAGNVGQANEKVDGISPLTIDSIALQNPTKPNHPITGKGEADAKVTVSFPDGTTAVTTVGKDGTWSVKNPGNLKDGQIVTAVAEDVAGNTVNASQVADGISKPTITAILDDVAGGIEGNIIIPHSNDPADESEVIRWTVTGTTVEFPVYSSNDLNPVLVGTGEPGAILTIYGVNGDAIGSTTVDQDGQWTYKDFVATENQMEGFTVAQTDKLGNVSDTSDMVVAKFNTFFDSSSFHDSNAVFTADTVTFDIGNAQTEALEDRVKMNTVRFYGTNGVTDKNSSIYIADINGNPVEGVVWTTTGNVLSAQLPSTFNGSYTVVVPEGSYYDYAGNTNTTYMAENSIPQVKFIYDNVNNPSDNVVGLEDGQTTDATELTLMFDVWGGDVTYYLRVDGVDYAPIYKKAGDISAVAIRLDDGPHEISYAMSYKTTDVTVTSGYSETFHVNVQAPAAGTDNRIVSTQVDNYYDTTDGGHDTVIFKLLNSAETSLRGGNGHDTWVGFGVDDSTGGKDTIDVRNLLSENFVNSSNVNQFISVKQVTNSDGKTDTVLSVDRDGSTGSKFASGEFLTLKNVDVSLDELLKNNQLLF